MRFCFKTKSKTYCIGSQLIWPSWTMTGKFYHVISCDQITCSNWRAIKNHDRNPYAVYIYSAVTRGNSQAEKSAAFSRETKYAKRSHMSCPLYSEIIIFPKNQGKYPKKPHILPEKWEIWPPSDRDIFIDMSYVSYVHHWIGGKTLHVFFPCDKSRPKNTSVQTGPMAFWPVPLCCKTKCN